MERGEEVGDVKGWRIKQNKEESRRWKEEESVGKGIKKKA